MSSRSVCEIYAGAGVDAGASFAIEEENPETFLRAVHRALEYTAAGDVYQTNLSREWQGRAARHVSPVDIYQRLRATNPSPLRRCFVARILHC